MNRYFALLKHGSKPEMASIKPDGTDERVLGESHDPTLSLDGKLIEPPRYQMAIDGSRANWKPIR